MSRLRANLREVEYAVVDLETTGLIAGKDRVVEIAVCHVDPKGPPRVVFASLINPCKAVTATEIHGLTSVDLADAPRFSDISNDLAAALRGRVIVGYNVEFDLAFLAEEWRQLGVVWRPLPHICALKLRSGLGHEWQPLVHACALEGVKLLWANSAVYDALALAELFDRQLDQLARIQVTTLAALARKWPYAFGASLGLAPLGDDEIPPHPRRSPRPRTAFLRSLSDIAIYQNALLVALADLYISPEELRMIAALKARLDLPEEFVRAVHARIFAMFLAMATDDERLDPREAGDIHKLWDCLATLGWAPGS